MTTTNGRKCIGTGSFTQIHGSQLEEIPDGLTLFVALTPNQFTKLCSVEPVIPDPYSGRFGLRANQLTAVQRSREFMNWRQDGRDPGNGGHVHQKNSLCVPRRLHHWGTLHSWKPVPSRRGMDRAIIELVIFVGMDRCSKREPLSIKVPMKYSSESWMSSWRLYKSLFGLSFLLLN